MVSLGKGEQQKMATDGQFPCPRDPEKSDDLPFMKRDETALKKRVADEH